MVLTTAFLVIWLVLCVAAVRAMVHPDGPRRRRRWRIRLARRLEAAAARLRHARPEDPFEVLWVQTRLGIVARHVQRLEADLHMPARAERILSTQLAYDALLAQACGLAGVDVPEHAPLDPSERFREEVELAARGWSW